MTQITEYSPFVPEVKKDPYPYYAWLREHHPVYYNDKLGFYVLSRYADVEAAARTPEVFSSAQGIGPERAPVAMMIAKDPPDHTRLRTLVQKAFTPRVIADLRPLVEQLVDAALDEFDTTGTVDIIGDLAFPLPFLVISRMLGMPETDAARLRDWSHTMTKTLDPILSDDDIRAASDAEAHMNAFLLDVFEWKRSEPADDLLTALLAAEDAGDVLSDDELLAQVSLLFIAGHETTVNLIGNGTYALLRNRDQWERLVREPELDANVADELLRYDSPVQFSGRTVLTEVALEGKTLPAGSSTMVCLGAANRDPAHWGDTAESLDIGRAGANQHLSFGGGVHYCLGSALARLEGQIAIGRMARRFPRMELASDTPAWNGRLVLRGLDELPVRTS